jgi:DNA-binding CsgD family transcriptional regulator
MAKSIKKTKEISTEYTLSEKEIYILDMAANDYSRKDIAEYFGLSVRTIEAVFAKLQMITKTKTMGGLIGYCFKNKILS